MNFAAFAESTEGLLAAIGTFLTGIAAVLTAYRQFRSTRKRQKEGRMSRGETVSRYITTTAIVGICLLLVSGALFFSRAYSDSKQPLNVELTLAAWDAFNNGNFERAMANAEKCIKEFRGAADREQASLENSKTALPGTGKVSEEEKKVIISRGLLNDVATCFFIKGKSAENLGRKTEAEQAYRAASAYSYARCWDPKGWFWSPAEAAQDRLATLK